MTEFYVLGNEVSFKPFVLLVCMICMVLIIVTFRIIDFIAGSDTCCCTHPITIWCGCTTLPRKKGLK